MCQNGVFMTEPPQGASRTSGKGWKTVRVPAATQVAAKAPDGSNLVFETEQDIALTGAKLAQVVSVWPGRDGYLDHTPSLSAGVPSALFDGAITTSNP